MKTLTSWMLTVIAIIALAAPAALTTTARADIDGEEPRPFEVLLSSQPIVVIARAEGETRTSVKRFDRDVNEPFAEVYTHHTFRSQRTFKGKLADERFEVRVLGGRAEGIETNPAVALPRDREVLMILTPDVGKDASGKPRRGYLVAHRAVYPIVNGQIETPGPSGPVRWSIEDVAAKIKEIEKQRRARYERNEEPASDRDALVEAGEHGQQPKERPPAASKVERRPGLAKGKQDVAPIVVRSPADLQSGDTGTSVSVKLRRGMNVIGVPLMPAAPWRVSDLAALLEEDAAVISWMDDRTGAMVSYFPAAPSPGEDKIIGAGDGFIVHMTRSKTIVFTGTAWTDSIAAVTGHER